MGLFLFKKNKNTECFAGTIYLVYVKQNCINCITSLYVKKNSLGFSLQLLEYFVEEYFDQNPISQVSTTMQETGNRNLFLKSYFQF